MPGSYSGLQLFLLQAVTASVAQVVSRRLPALAAFHHFQDLVGGVEGLGMCVPDLLYQLLGGVVALGDRDDLVLLGRKRHALQGPLQEGFGVEVAKVT
jgi:hypothetical protein